MRHDGECVRGVDGNENIPSAKKIKGAFCRAFVRAARVIVVARSILDS